MVFAWSADPSADRYDLRYAISKDRVPPCDGCAGASPVDGSAPTFVPAAVHRAAVDGPAGTTLFYGVRPGCGPDRIGACCTPAACLHVSSETDCALNGGVYAGDTTLCTEVSCPVTLGSCCNPEGSCSLRNLGGPVRSPRREVGSRRDLHRLFRANGARRLLPGVGVRRSDGANRLQRRRRDVPRRLHDVRRERMRARLLLPPRRPLHRQHDRGQLRRGLGHLHPCDRVLHLAVPGRAGACCTGGVCQDGVLRFACGFPGSWHGPGSACAGVACPSACCTGGTCSLQLPAACAAAGGSYQGDGIACAASVCAAGACCLAASCDEGVTAAECATRGGAYAGAGSTCAAGACATGACCIGSGCDERIASSCAAAFGTFRGTGTTCASVSSCQGACCWWGGCEDGLTPDDCSSLMRGSHQGDGTVCAADSCPGACCLIHGCAVLPIETCIAGGGSPPIAFPAPTCGQGPCTFLDRRKCCGLFGCYPTTSDECARSGGTWDGSQTSCIQPCAVGTGACCEGTACSGQTATLCQLRGGQFRGYGTTCDSNGQCVGSTVCSCASTPCATGACCGIDTGCEILDEQQCCIRGGTLEVGSSCSPACDPVPCCLGGQCVLLAPGVCAAEGGAANGCVLGGGC